MKADVNRSHHGVAAGIAAVADPIKESKNALLLKHAHIAGPKSRPRSICMAQPFFKKPDMRGDFLAWPADAAQKLPPDPAFAARGAPPCGLGIDGVSAYYPLTQMREDTCVASH